MRVGPREIFLSTGIVLYLMWKKGGILGKKEGLLSAGRMEIQMTSFFESIYCILSRVVLQSVSL